MVSLYPAIRKDSNLPPNGEIYQFNAAELNFEQVINQLIPLPKTSMLLGVCEDGFPLMLEFDNQDLGALLIAGDNWYGNQLHLDRMVRSAGNLNTREEIKIHLISRHLEQHSELIQTAISGQVFNPLDIGSQILVEELIRLVKERLRGKDSEMVQLLAVDELDMLVNEFDDNSIKQFHWLLRNGPSQRIWVVATLASNQMNRKFKALLDCFNVKAFGRIESPTESIQIAGKPFIDLSRQIPGVECIVRHQNIDTKISIPQL